MSSPENKEENEEAKATRDEEPPPVAVVAPDDTITPVNTPAKDPVSPAPLNNSNHKNKNNKNKNTNNKSSETLLSVRSHEQNKDSEELTKRLQRLALERQKASTGDRLKVIQSNDNNNMAHLHGVQSFQELNLPSHLLDALFQMGFDRPSAIQEEALPRILQGRNLIGQAQSGSGKTAAFTLGMLAAIQIDDPPTTQAVCVTPTRELAIQIVDKAVTPMAALMKGLHITLAIAGAELPRNTKQVSAHILVGTPGKLVDWLKRKAWNPKTIKVFVLDEADAMVSEQGHRANSLLLHKQLPPKCQSLLFSATFSPEVVQYANKLVKNADQILIEQGPEYLMLDIIKQLWIDTREYPGGKIEFLADSYGLLTIGQSIVFVQTVRDADLVANTLSQAGYTCSVLHGRVEGAERDHTMEAFRAGESNVLITTNVLARGVDVDNVCLVINYDVPVTKDQQPDYETYLHRIGRTGRFGRKGTAINLISDERSLQILASIEQFYAKEGKEMIQKAEADPEQLAEVIEI